MLQYILLCYTAMGYRSRYYTNHPFHGTKKVQQFNTPTILILLFLAPFTLGVSLVWLLEGQ